MPDLMFAPETAIVAVGGTVRWVNTSTVGHTVTAYETDIPASASYFASGGFSSELDARQNLAGGLISPNEEYVHSFDVQGEYEYFCIPHERTGMIGTITVE